MRETRLQNACVSGLDQAKTIAGCLKVIEGRLRPYRTLGLFPIPGGQWIDDGMVTKGLVPK